MSTPILSLRKLAWTIGVPLERLQLIASSIQADRLAQYRVFPLKTGRDKVRLIRPPKDELMNIQRRIVKNILAPMKLADCAHGGVRGRSPRTNAEVHCGQPLVVQVDVEGFFDNVQHRRVYRMFRQEHGFGRDVSRLLVRLITLDGALPQGAPTSPLVANLFVGPVDDTIKSAIQKGEVSYSRFVDDLTFSGQDPRALIGVAARALSARGLSVKRSKLSIASRSKPQEVTGLLVNNAGRLSVSRKGRDAIRAAIFQLQSVSKLEAEAQIRSIRGRIAYIERFHPGEATRLRQYLAARLQQADFATPDRVEPSKLA